MKNKLLNKLNQVVGLRRIFIAVMLLGVALGSIAIGQERGGGFGETVETKAVRLLLTGYHGVPSRAVLETASPNARVLLMGYANDPLAGMQRERAILALAHWPTPDTLWVYRRALKDPTITTSGRQSMMLQAAKTFGPTVLEDLKGFLKSDDVQTRITAVTALASMNSDTAFGVLDAHSKVEKAVPVLDALAQKGRRIR